MDRDLVIRAQHGDEEAFADLVAAAGPRLHAVARRVLRDLDLADDATQRAFVGIWRDLPKLRTPDRFEAWSYRILLRTCFDEGRRGRVWSKDIQAVPPFGEVQADAADVVINRDLIERGFRRLSLEHRAVVVLRYYVDLPLDEIAAVLDIPPGTARSRLHHALRSLRAAVGAAEPVPVAAQEAAR